MEIEWNHHSRGFRALLGETAKRAIHPISPSLDEKKREQQHQNGVR